MYFYSSAIFGQGTVRKAYFDILSRVGVTHECDRQTDGRSDIIANVALHYAAQPMS